MPSAPRRRHSREPSPHLRHPADELAAGAAQAADDAVDVVHREHDAGSDFLASWQALPAAWTSGGGEGRGTS